MDEREDAEFLARKQLSVFDADRAPAEKVDALRERANELEGQIATLNTNLEALA